MTHKKDFAANEEDNNQTPLEDDNQEQAELSTNEPQRQQLKIMLVGSPEVVRSAIHYFYLKDEAEVADWSPFQKSPSNPEEVISILYRKMTVQ